MCDLLAQKQEAGSVDFWRKESTEKYPDFAKLMSLPTYFGYSAICSTSRVRTGIHLHKRIQPQACATILMRISSSTLKPNFEDIIRNINVPIQDTPH